MAAHVTIRLADADDLYAINDIYNYYVRHSTCTYQIAPETIESRRTWFANHDAAHPVTVATNSSGIVVGWGALSRFHAREAYDRTVENAVYVHHGHHRQGIGRKIVGDLMARALAVGHRTIIAGISADQTASIALHAGLGFVQVGLLKEVGFKMNRWLDVIYMQKIV